MFFAPDKENRELLNAVPGFLLVLQLKLEFKLRCQLYESRSRIATQERTEDGGWRVHR
jgi:hypothetical protein